MRLPTLFTLSCVSELRVIRPATEGAGRQQLGYFLGIHQAVNLSETEPAVAIIARNDANEHERVVLYQA